MCNHSKEHINRKELFEVEGLGNNTLVRNNMSPELAKKLFERFAKQYVPRKKQIERLIKGLRKKIMKCNPLQLLSFCADNFLMSTGTVQSEYQLDGDDILNSRLTEYVQSVMVSSKSTYKPGHKDSSKYFAAIQRDFARLQLLIMKFYFSWTAVLNEQHPEYDEETQMILAEAQLLFANVRGQRYQVHEVEYLEKLLSGHEAIFVSSFGISTAQIIDGIWNEEPDRVMIEVAFDESLAVTSFEFSECTADDIRIEERDILQQMAYDRAQIRVALSLQQEQLRDNDLCPCGSGKVYSNCCRDRFMHN